MWYLNSRAGKSARIKAAQLIVKRVKKYGRFAGAAGAAGGLLGAAMRAGVWETAGLAVASGITSFVVLWKKNPNEATRWLQGAAGEARTGKILNSMKREGWWVGHDRSLPGTRANVDHLVVHPSGRLVINLDTKAWHAKNAKVKFEYGRLMYGPWRKNDAVDTIRMESDKVRQVVRVKVISMIVLDGAHIDRRQHPSGLIEVASDFYVVEQGSVKQALRQIEGGVDRVAVKRIAGSINKQLPPYRQGK